jgi:acetyl esterase/lipase
MRLSIRQTGHVSSMHKTPSVLLVFAVVVAIIRPAAAQTEVEIRPDVVYGHKDGLAMTFDVYTPKDTANGAGVLFMVSGGWFSTWAPPEQLQPLFQPLLEKGFTVFSVRHGSSPKYNIPEVVSDVRRAVRFVRYKASEFNVDPERLGVYGGSAGGHLSLVLGTASDDGDPRSGDEVLQVSNRVAAVAAIFPPTDLREWVANPPENIKSFPALRFEVEKAPDYSPLLHVTPDDPPTLLIHGDKDDLVPISHSENIQKAFAESKVPHELIVIEGGGHGFNAEQNKRVSDAIVAWFEKHLASKPPAETE